MIFTEILLKNIIEKEIGDAFLAGIFSETQDFKNIIV